MHYAPDESRVDDEASTSTSGKRSRKSRGARRSRDQSPHSLNTRNDGQPQKQTSQKTVQKKLGKFIKKTFTKPQQQQQNNDQSHHQTPLHVHTAPTPSVSSATGPSTTEYDALMHSYINCHPKGSKSTNNSVASGSGHGLTHCDSPSVLTHHSHNTFSNTPMSSNATKIRNSNTGSNSRPSQQQSYQQQQQQQQQPSSSTMAGSHVSNNNSGHGHGGAYPDPSSKSKYGSALSTSSPSFDDNQSNKSKKETEAERAHRIAKAQEGMRAQMSFSLWHCLAAILVYVGGSIVCFSLVLEPEWNFVTSSYFAVVTFTTIGYGDVVPDTMDARLFTCFWAISGVAFLGIALGVIGSNLIEVAHEDKKKAHVHRQKQLVGIFDHYDDVTNTVGPGVLKNKNSPKSRAYYDTIEEGRRRVMFDDIEDSDDEDNPQLQSGRRQRQQAFSWCSWSLGMKLCRAVLLLLFFVGNLYAIALTEGWDLVTTVYYAIITASTVGYGDFSPQTDAGRALAIVFIPVAVSAMGIFLGTVANGIISYRQNAYVNYIQNKPLTVEDIRNLDQNGDGNVTRAEFFQFMLVAMNQCDKSVFDGLNAHFDRLDIDKSGTLDKDDLATMAKRQITMSSRDNDSEIMPGSHRLANYRDYQQKQPQPSRSRSPQSHQHQQPWPSSPPRSLNRPSAIGDADRQTTDIASNRTPNRNKEPRKPTKKSPFKATKKSTFVAFA